MRIKDFYAILEGDSDVDVAMIPIMKELTTKFPIFQAGIFVYLKCLYLANNSDFVPELSRLSPFVHDKRALFYYILNSLYSKFQIQTESKVSLSDRTSILIDSFFETLGDTDIFNNLQDSLVNENQMVSQDYFSFLSKDDKNGLSSLPYNIDALSEKEETSTDEYSLIDKFISESKNSNNIFANKLSESNDKEFEKSSNDDLPIDDKGEDDYFFTQTLVDVYIKQKKYARAYEIIQGLNLNNTEKNIYFADQIVFLENILKISNNK